MYDPNYMDKWDYREQDTITVRKKNLNLSMIIIGGAAALTSISVFSLSGVC